MKSKILNKNILLFLFFSLVSLICGKLAFWQISRGFEKKTMIAQEKSINFESIKLISNKKYIIENGDKSYKIFEIAEIENEVYFLEIGKINSLTEIPALTEEDLKGKTFSYWPIKNNKFIKKEKFINQHYEKAYQLSSFFNDIEYAKIHKDYFIFIKDKLNKYQPIDHTIPISPQKHFGYAFQWFLFGGLAFFYAIFLFRNKKFSK